MGSLIELTATAAYILKQANLGGHMSLYSLSSLYVERGGIQLLNKDRDQYFSAGPEVKYKINSDLSFILRGDYLFNSNENEIEDHLKDLFGNGLGQWKWTVGADILFF
ncbi:MAG: hypothetical protein HOP07_15780 [Bacteriovoracaceae bacterium]|nr:hypothetical protein [Bacteriovoracaceae bacterium]